MTGFARSSHQADMVSIVWEAKSVNGKGLDVRFRSPINLDSIEALLRKKVTAVLSRGSIHISLSITQDNLNDDLAVNTTYLEKLLELSDKLHANYGLQEPTIDGLLALKGVVENNNDTLSDINSDELLKQNLQNTFDILIDDLVKMRQIEGKALQTILLSQLEKMKLLIVSARQDPSRSVAAIKEKLKNNIDALMDTNVTFDQNRLHMEAILLATRADIQEELDRLDAHINAAETLIISDGAVGRKLDFLAQEFNREANTLCAKANSPSLSNIGLSLKSVIDQWREQIQNLE